MTDLFSVFGSIFAPDPHVIINNFHHKSEKYKMLAKSIRSCDTYEQLDNLRSGIDQWRLSECEREEIDLMMNNKESNLSITF